MLSVTGSIQRGMQLLHNIFKFSNDFTYPENALGNLNNPGSTTTKTTGDTVGLSNWKIWTGSPQAGDGTVQLGSAAPQTLATLFFRRPFNLAMSLDISNNTSNATSAGLALFVKDQNNYFAAYQQRTVLPTFVYDGCTTFGTTTGTNGFRFVSQNYIAGYGTRFTRFSPTRPFSSTFFAIFAFRTFTTANFTSFFACSAYGTVSSTSSVTLAIIEKRVNGSSSFFSNTVTSAISKIRVKLSQHLNEPTVPSGPGIQDSRSVYPSSPGFPGHFRVWFEDSVGTSLYNQYVEDYTINNWPGEPQHTHGIIGFNQATEISTSYN